MELTIQQVLSQGPATSRQLQTATGLTQAAVSRGLRSMGNQVVRFKRGRTPYYAMTRNAFGADDWLPLVMVDRHGNNRVVAYVRPLQHGGYYLQQESGMPSLLAGGEGNGLFDDLPYFLDDLRPQGFLGRQIAAQLAEQGAGFPHDLRNWNSNHVGRYLIANGDDLSGNFKFGPQALSRIRRKVEVSTPEQYPELAESVLAGTLPGSSAGGEQPKFTTYCGERSAHVLVKFSPPGDEALARRWRDILITEHHATEALHEAGLPAAETRLIEAGGRLFLESQRLDRSGEFGRSSMISMQAIDAEFVGLGTNWTAVAYELLGKGLLSNDHAIDILFLQRFGQLINNSDMHLGNLSFSIEGSMFHLLPVYDMCSMGFAPRSGELMEYQFTPPARSTGLDQLVDQRMTTNIEELARDFWKRVAADSRISGEFQQFLQLGNPLDRMVVDGDEYI